MKEEIIKALFERRIIAIIRGFSPDVCLRLAEAYAKGGIGFVEVTFNQRAPETWKDTAAAIRSIRERFAGAVRVGAGTVLTEEQLGTGYVKAVCAPLSHIPFLAVGGISPENVGDFVRAGCAGAGVGGNLTNKEWIASGAWEKISETARHLVANANRS